MSNIIARLPKVEQKEKELKSYTTQQNDTRLTMQEKYASLPGVKSEPEKAKEEKVEEILIEINNAKIGLVAKARLDTNVTKVEIRLSEAVRIAQLPEVIAEVERQRAEKEIKVGDWIQHAKGFYDKCEFVDGAVIFCRWGGYVVKKCTKITDPAFIALLEQGAKG